jgi:hypothetical protein
MEISYLLAPATVHVFKGSGHTQTGDTPHTALMTGRSSARTRTRRTSVDRGEPAEPEVTAHTTLHTPPEAEHVT